MTTIYIALKIGALLAFILAPVIGVKKGSRSLSGISAIAVNADGYLEHFSDSAGKQHPVK